MQRRGIVSRWLAAGRVSRVGVPRRLVHGGLEAEALGSTLELRLDSTNLDGTGLDWTGAGLERRGVSGPKQRPTRPGPRSSTSTQQLGALLFSPPMLERRAACSLVSAPPIASPCLALLCLALPLLCLSALLSVRAFVAGLLWCPRWNLLCSACRRRFCCSGALICDCDQPEMQQLGAWVEAQVPGGGSAFD